MDRAELLLVPRIQAIRISINLLLHPPARTESHLLNRRESLWLAGYFGCFPLRKCAFTSGKYRYLNPTKSFRS